MTLLAPERETKIQDKTPLWGGLMCPLKGLSTGGFQQQYEGVIKTKSALIPSESFFIRAETWAAFLADDTP